MLLVDTLEKFADQNGLLCAPLVVWSALVASLLFVKRGPVAE